MFRSITSRSLQSFRKSNKRSPGGFTLFGCSTIKIPKNNIATVFKCTLQKTRYANLDHWGAQQKRHFFSSQFPKISDAEKSLNNSNNHTSVSYKNKKVEDWNVDNVAEWARDELKFNNESVDVLKKRQIRGTSLFTFDNKQELVSMGLEIGPAGELWVAIQNLKTKQAVDPSTLVAEWQRLSSQYPTDLVSAFGSKMPVVQRSKEISMAWNELKTHYHGWKAHRADRKDHPRCFAYGPPGSGKTKFGIELISLLRSFGQQIVDNNKATSEDKEILKLLSNSIFIHITFANGNALLPHETQNVETALVVRGIRSLFGLTEMKISMFYTQFGEKIKKWNLDTLTEIAHRYFSNDRSTPTMIYIHLDEFNHLYNKDFEIFKQVVDLLSTPLCTPLPGVFYDVLFTGTAYTGMKKLGVSESYPLTELPMQILDIEGIMEVVSTMHKNGRLSWVDDSWKENKPFVLSLLNTGGLPRAIEYLLEELEMRAKAFKNNINQMTTQDIEAASNSAETRLLTRYGAAFVKSTAVYTEAFALGILGETIRLNSELQLEKSETYASLLSTGSILLKSVDNEGWVIQLPVIWLNKYIQELQLNSIVSKEIYEELTSIKPGTWSQWERITAIMLMLRTNAIKLLRRNEFIFSDIFPGAKGSNDVLDRKFETYQDFYKRRDFPKQFLKNPKNTMQEDEAARLFMEGTVWLNGLRGPAFDLWTVYKNKKDLRLSTKSYTITFVQCKFSSANEPLKTMDIIKEYNELQEMWNNMLIEFKTSPIEGSNIQLTDYDIIFVVVSNRAIQENHKTDDHSISKALSKCIIYDQLSVSSFFSTFSNQIVQSFKQ